MAEAVKIRGYRRGGGRFGVRNHVLVVSTVSCANSLVEQMAAAAGAVPITHPHGCTMLGDDREQLVRTLAGICDNPNVGGVLLVGLGCECVAAADVAERVGQEGRIVRTRVIQEIGSRRRLMELAAADLAEIQQFAAARQAEEADLSELVVALECGGSDPFSGITANPAVGRVSDRLVEAGATVILSEVPEMIGAEAALAGRIHDDAVRERLFARIADYVRIARRQGTDLRGVNPTPGNVAAGLTTIEEKSLGCIVKAGRTPIREFIHYAERPRGRGLVVMDTPGNDPESVTGMAAGGATVILFTTGVGTPMGCPVAPVIKISSNTPLYERMGDFIDVDAGRIVDGADPQAIADELFGRLVGVCRGELTAAERNRCGEFAVNRIGATF